MEYVRRLLPRLRDGTVETVRRPQRRTRRKKKAALAPADRIDRRGLERMAKTARYNPSPYHKSAPSGSPRHDKTVCDGPASTGRDGRELLTSGFRRGMVSSQERRGWPQNVWAVDEDGVAYEAQLGNAELGEYHGYPMKMDDDFVRVVRRAWEDRSP